MYRGCFAFLAPLGLPVAGKGHATERPSGPDPANLIVVGTAICQASAIIWREIAQFVRQLNAQGVHEIFLVHGTPVAPLIRPIVPGRRHPGIASFSNHYRCDCWIAVAVIGTKTPPH